MHQDHPNLSAIVGLARRRSSTLRTIALAATAIVACSFARSDARPETDAAHALNLTHIVGSWYGPDARDARAARDAADSANAMLVTTKIDALENMADRVAPLHVDTEIHARRIAQVVEPRLRFTLYLPPGARRTVKRGVPEVAWVTERVTLWNDVVVDRHELSREVVRPGTPGIVEEGSPRTLAQLRSLKAFRSMSQAMTMVATAYTADTASAYPTGYTATGVLARRGIVAVDPDVIPLGTTLFVPGYGVAVAADTGGAIVGHRIDLCMDSYSDAVTFGRQTIQIYILKQ